MAARGTVAKLEVENKIALAFGDDFIGEVDKKLFVWANDGSERVQIAITMTCPKNPVEIPGVSTTKDYNDHDWSNDDIITTPKSTPKVEISEEEKKNIAEMMARLGL